MNKINKLRTLKEAEFAACIKKEVSNLNAFYFKSHGHTMQAAGMPDIYIAVPNCFVGWVELKIGSNKVAPLQAHQIEKLNKCGSFALCLRLSVRTRMNAVTLMQMQEYVVSAFLARTVPYDKVSGGVIEGIAREEFTTNVCDIGAVALKVLNRFSVNR